MTYRNRAAITALLVRAVPGAVTTAVLRGCNHGPEDWGVDRCTLPAGDPAGARTNRTSCAAELDQLIATLTTARC